MDKTYYITEIEQAISRIRVGMSNLRDIDNNFAALASGLTRTAEWVEAHAPLMKGYRSIELDEIEIMMPVQVLTHKNRWEPTTVVGFVRSDGLQQVELLNPYRKPGIGAASRITLYGKTIKSHIRVPAPTEDKEDE